MKIKKFDSINVVPFIDIILVLLVIVLTSASFIANGLIPIDLSEASSAKQYKTKPKELIITIKKNETFFINKNQIDKNRIENILKSYKKDTIVNINCDKDVKFKNFVYIMNILKKYNFKNLGIITKK